MSKEDILYVLKVDMEVLAMTTDKELFCCYIINRKIGRFRISEVRKTKEKQFYINNYPDKIIYKDEVRDDVTTIDDTSCIDSIVEEEKYKLNTTLQTMMDYTGDGYFLKDEERDILKLAIQILVKKTKPKKFFKFINYNPEEIDFDILKKFKEIDKR